MQCKAVMRQLPFWRVDERHVLVIAGMLMANLLVKKVGKLMNKLLTVAYQIVFSCVEKTNFIDNCLPGCGSIEDDAWGSI